MTSRSSSVNATGPAAELDRYVWIPNVPAVCRAARDPVVVDCHAVG
ncbi:hypothetical protein [Clavibacter zhangzhiyongii]|nr:hypothetical protein [Clavibacter zhangzhiyongii]MBM7027046.1 hypothetical protein [Clavibacter zhangzhiyongii]